MTTNMNAIECTKYGSADVLEYREVEKPAPKENEVLVKIAATSVTAAHCAMRTGKPLFGRLFTGLSRPKNPIPGTDLAGEVVAVGKDVTLFKVGDEVFGSSDLGGGCYAEYTCLSEEEALAMKPANMKSEEASAIIDGAATALPFLRDHGKIQSGQKVLINGASGGVGTAAVQLAKQFGAEVTGVCSSRNVAMVKSLGADKIIDYVKEDFTQNGESYDIIFDTVGKRSFSQCKGSLSENGVYLSTVLGLSILWPMLRTSIAGSKKAVFAATGLRPTEEKSKDLLFLKELIEAGKLKAVIDRCYPLEEAAEAQRYVEKGHKKGNVVIRLG